VGGRAPDRAGARKVSGASEGKDIGTGSRRAQAEAGPP
jgi:hypothetical protein